MSSSCRRSIEGSFSPLSIFLTKDFHWGWDSLDRTSCFDSTHVSSELRSSIAFLLLADTLPPPASRSLLSVCAFPWFFSPKVCLHCYVHFPEGLDPAELLELDPLISDDERLKEIREWEESRCNPTFEQSWTRPNEKKISQIASIEKRIEDALIKR